MTATTANDLTGFDIVLSSYCRARVIGVVRKCGETARVLCWIQYFGKRGTLTKRAAYVWLDADGAGPSKAFQIHRL